MGYQALLFCPDEKTARTVTQVLSELEFSVEACMEPFAAVKKLMGQHFDAIVVDCDNEQNAALLFKSARSSTSNQASLAVAVVEGQAGVAKAFRIGANLVLTKPINVEQAKGTLRVARGLLRKGDPAKPGTAAALVAAATPAPAAAAPKPAAPKPVAPKPAPVAPIAVASPRPAAPVALKPPAPPVRPLAAVASAAPIVPEVKKEIPEIKAEASAPKLPVPVAAAPVSTPAALPTTFSGGAASAPAPAREIHDVPQDAAAATPTLAITELVLDAPAEEVHAEAASTDSYSSSNSTFTFGGANVAETSSGSKKIFLGIGAAVLVLGALYFAWTNYKSGPTQPTIALPTTGATSPSTTPQSAPQAAKPAPAQPKPAAQAPLTSAPASTTQPTAVSTIPAITSNSDSGAVPEEDAPAPSRPEGKSAAKASAPLMVKGGSAPAVHAKPATADAPPPPSMMAIVATGSSAPPPNIGGSAKTPKPILQTLTISQGVSQGLLVKKVQPVYPKSALAMQVEGAVQLAATISKNGDISAVKVLKGPAQLTKAAADAVKQWKYKPYLLNGEPVEIQTEVTINFKLPH